MSLTISDFGNTEYSTKLYTLKNESGMEVALTDFGATLVKLIVPDRRGVAMDVTLGFDDFESYLINKPYFGSTIGRFANRIAGGCFRLQDLEHRIAQNNGPNALHGGTEGFGKKVWEVTPGDDELSLIFHRISPDGEEGYPGTVTVSVTYRLEAKQNTLSLHYEARTDQTTIINLTNHAYFNLAGESAGTTLHHTLRVPAEAFIPVNDHLIPTGELRAVKGTPFNFQDATVIGERLGALSNTPAGYDHCYVLRQDFQSGEMHLAAELSEPISGRVLRVETDQPAIQIYTGNFLDGSIPGKNGHPYERHAGIALETQHFPDAPNQAHFPSTVLHPGETLRTTTILRFSTD